jgi:protoporphyrinogen oxidase
MKTLVVVGAGPAGLTAAYEVLKRSSGWRVVVLEETKQAGGISRTVVYKGNRMDMGGHRFFSKIQEVNQWWDQMLPRQGSLAMDDRLLGRSASLSIGGPDPDEVDQVMLRRRRISRIFFNRKFFDYPISLKLGTFVNMGFCTTIVACLSYLKSVLVKRKEDSLEDFYINRFGKKLYSMFFERYTENLWGRHPCRIDPSWGAQRVKGVSIAALVKNALHKIFHVKSDEVETSLIEEFSYPKLGPGQLWEVTADKVTRLGGEIIYDAKVTGVRRNDDGIISSIVYEDEGGKRQEIKTHALFSSMPLKDLVMAMDSVPQESMRIASGLPYRDYMTVGVLVSGLALKNKTKMPTLGGIVPDNWVYVHDSRVKMGRFQIYNNWSPYLVANPEGTVWLGLEYFCNEGDALWTKTDDEFAADAIKEMVELGLINNIHEVLDFHVERVKKAYPAYFDTYSEINVLRTWLDTIPNLYCIGRNGQHRYNNIDHSMCTAFRAVEVLLDGSSDKTKLWNVNTEHEYHESK